MYGTFTYIWLILIVNVGKSTSPMDGMGDAKKKNGRETPTSQPFICPGGLIQHIPPLEREKQQHRSKYGIVAKKRPNNLLPHLGVENGDEYHGVKCESIKNHLPF